MDDIKKILHNNVIIIKRINKFEVNNLNFINLIYNT